MNVSNNAAQKKHKLEHLSYVYSVIRATLIKAGKCLQKKLNFFH